MMGRLRALGLALLLLPASAGAQPKPPTDLQKQQAGDLVKKAIARSQAGDHTLAIDLYQQAYLIVPTALLLSNIGAEYQAMGNKPVEALKYFCKYLDADPNGSNATYATAQVKTLQIQQGITPDERDVCKPAPPPPSSGTIAGSADVGAGSGSAIAGPSLGSAAAPEPEPSLGKPLEIAGAGVAAIGVTGVVVGVIYALKGKSLGDFQRHHSKADTWPSSYDGVPIADWNSTGAAWNRDAYLFTISGGVLALAGAAMFYLGYTKSATPAEHARLVPTASPTSGGIALTGRF